MELRYQRPKKRKAERILIHSSVLLSGALSQYVCGLFGLFGPTFIHGLLSVWSFKSGLVKWKYEGWENFTLDLDSGNKRPLWIMFGDAISNCTWTFDNMRSHSAVCMPVQAGNIAGAKLYDVSRDENRPIKRFV